jgi:integrase/recombinase XerD
MTLKSPLRQGNQQASVSADPLALAHVRSRSAKEGWLYVRGARELVDFLARSGKPPSAVGSEDLAAFKAAVRSREGEDQAGIERARAKIEGACAYLRFLSCRGELVEDEALFFALNERITPGVVASAFGESLRARILREAAAFRETLAAEGKDAKVSSDHQRAAVRLLFFLERRGKRVSDFEPGDWVAFEDEVKGGLAGELVLAGARAYLRRKGVAAALGQGKGTWKRPREVKNLALLSPESRRELLSFRERLTGAVGASTRHAYVWGARELLLFAERRGVTIGRLSLDDWRAFEAEIRAREARGELGRSWLPGALSGARRYLRERAERGGAIEESLLPYVTPHDLETRCGIEAARDGAGAAILREVEAFARERASRGYEDTPNARQGALALLRFVLRRGLTLADMTAADWADFRREAPRGTRYRDPSSLLGGASAYLRIKVEQGVLARSPVPPRPVPRASPPALPEELEASLAHLEEGMAARDLAPGTRKSYRRAVWELLAWAYEEHGVSRMGDISRDMLSAYRLRLQSEPTKKGTPCALLTQIGTLCALRFFFSWLVETGRLLADPTRHLPYPRSPRYLPRSLEVAEIARFIRSLPKDTLGLRDRALVELLYGTGMRRGEASKLDLSDVDFEQRQVLVRQGKGRKDRVVPLGRKAKEALLDYLERGRAKLVRGADPGALFLGRDGRRLGKGQISDRLRALGLKIRLKLAPHLLRHSCATHLLKGRADIRHIQRLLGHESLQTTERYTRVEMADLRGVIDRCHPREKEGK